MAFLRTFIALTVAGGVWMAMFAGFGEANNTVLNLLAGWLSPLTVVGWLFYFVLCVVCFLLAWRFIGGTLTHAGEHDERPGA